MLAIIIFWGSGLTTETASAQDNGTAAGNEQVPEKARTKNSSFTNLAASELVRIDQQIQSQNEYAAMLSVAAATRRQVEPLRPMIATLKAQAATVCSQDEAARQSFRQQLQSLIERLSNAGEGLRGWQPLTAENLCSEGQPSLLLDEIDASTNIPDPSAEQRTVERTLADLAQQREDVLRGMTDDMAGASVADNIKWLMLIIFGVGGATLAGVTLFKDDVQRELIASGQIVQFVTILILLGVILALGLAQRLQAETLGTLLGGLAGTSFRRAWGGRRSGRC